MSVADVDDADLRLAAVELADARTMLRRAHAISDYDGRHEAIAVAVGKLGLVWRAIGVVLERHGAGPATVRRRRTKKGPRP